MGKFGSHRTINIRLWYILVLVFVSLIMQHNVMSQEDPLKKARKLFQQGSYDDSITVLKKYINKYENRVYYKKNVAEAYYVLAKVYFTVGEDKIVTENLEKSFKVYPSLDQDETDMEFKELVNQTRSKTAGQSDSTVTLLIPTEKSNKWYMERGDEYFSQHEYQKAKLFYQMVLDADQSDPVAKKKIKACEDKSSEEKEEQRFYHYLDKADGYLKNNEIRLALHYFLITVETFPLGKSIIAERLNRVAADYPDDWKQFLEHNQQKVKEVLMEKRENGKQSP